MADFMNDLIIFLPGITGSVLQKNGVDVWGGSAQAVWNAIKTRGASIQELAPPSDGSDDGFRATRLMTVPSIVAGLLTGDPYSVLSSLICENFNVVKGSLTSGAIESHPAADAPPNYFEFPYDWRKDNRIAANQLNKVVTQALAALHDHQGSDEAKVVLIAHSMGGLVARYYLEVLQGWCDCKMLITLGTPFQGAAKPLDFLANGYPVFGLEMKTMSAVLRACPSIYQLVSTSCIVKAGGKCYFARDMKELPNVDMIRVQHGFEFHQEICAAIEANKLKPGYADAAIIVPFVGTHQQTCQSLELDGDTLTPSYEIPTDLLPSDRNALANTGDGSVPYLSARPKEKSGPGTGRFYAERHGFLHSNLDIWAQLRQILRASQIKIKPHLLGPGDTTDAGIHLDGLQNVYASGEAMTFSAQVAQARYAPKGMFVQVTQVVSDTTDGNAPTGSTSPMTIVPATAEEERWRFQLSDLSPGLYNLEIYASGYGVGGPNPIHELFAVAD